MKKIEICKTARGMNFQNDLDIHESMIGFWSFGVHIPLIGIIFVLYMGFIGKFSMSLLLLLYPIFLYPICIFIQRKKLQKRKSRFFKKNEICENCKNLKIYKNKYYCFEFMSGYREPTFQQFVPNSPYSDYGHDVTFGGGLYYYIDKEIKDITNGKFCEFKKR